MASKEQQKQFIVKYLKSHSFIYITTPDFVSAFSNQFNISGTNIDRLLSSMALEGILNREKESVKSGFRYKYSLEQ